MLNHAASPLPCAVTVLAVCLLPNVAPAQARLAGLRTAIAEVEAGRRTTPIVEEAHGGDVLVTFLARRGRGPVPRIVSDVTGWGERPDDTFDVTAGTMRRVGHTDWYVLETTVAPGARIEYLVARGSTDYRSDPYNPRQARHRGGAPASEFVTPGYVPQQEPGDAPVTPAGRVEARRVETTTGAWGVSVYTPPGYREGGAYPVAVFLNGPSFVAVGDVPRLLDALIARGTIEPVVAVFVDSSHPEVSDAAAACLRSRLTGELLPWLASRYGISTSPAMHAIVGKSFDAKDVLDAATFGDVYGRAGLLLPGRRLKPSDISELVGRRSHPLRAVILAGRYDAANVATARRTRDALVAAGHTVSYVEVPEGHNAGTWITHLRDALVGLFGAGDGRGSERTREAGPR